MYLLSILYNLFFNLRLCYSLEGSFSVVNLNPCNPWFPLFTIPSDRSESSVGTLIGFILTEFCQGARVFDEWFLLIST